MSAPHRIAVHLPSARIASLVLLATTLAVGGAERVRLLFNVPAGAEGYSGIQPVTFGIPFERGNLRRDDGLCVVDAQGSHVTAQFDVTATWARESDEVRWLLVDLLVPIQNGNASNLFLEFGPDVPMIRAGCPA